MKEEAFYRQLVHRYLNNTATDEELALFFGLMKDGRLDQYLAEGMDAETGVASEQQSPVKKITKGWMAAAAILLLLLAASAYWLINKRSTPVVAQKSNTTQPVNDIAPGSNKAVLTLANGSKIILDSATNGQLAQQGKATVIKSSDGQLVYDAKALTTDNTPLTYNTLATPRGGQYRLTLPDGTQVWLNAASSIRYPTVFTGNERKVEITGEVYFEVVKNAAKPFKVAVRNMDVEVLGTHFNINAYDDEPVSKTTLIEGKVKVRSVLNGQWSIMKPGEQAAIHHSQLTIHDNIDVEEVMAWKNGSFSFTDANITTILRQAARWYNVEVVYEGNMSDEYFTGQLPRSENISSLLKFLELTKTVKCRIQDNKIIVRPAN